MLCTQHLHIPRRRWRLSEGGLGCITTKWKLQRRGDLQAKTYRFVLLVSGLCVHLVFFFPIFHACPAVCAVCISMPIQCTNILIFSNSNLFLIVAMEEFLALVQGLSFLVMAHGCTVLCECCVKCLLGITCVPTHPPPPSPSLNFMHASQVTLQVEMDRTSMVTLKHTRSVTFTHHSPLTTLTRPYTPHSGDTASGEGQQGGKEGGREGGQAAPSIWTGCVPC